MIHQTVINIVNRHAGHRTDSADSLYLVTCDEPGCVKELEFACSHGHWIGQLRLRGWSFRPGRSRVLHMCPLHSPGATP